MLVHGSRMAEWRGGGGWAVRPFLLKTQFSPPDVRLQEAEGVHGAEARSLLHGSGWGSSGCAEDRRP